MYLLTVALFMISYKFHFKISCLIGTVTYHTIIATLKLIGKWVDYICARGCNDPSVKGWEVHTWNQLWPDDGVQLKHNRCKSPSKRGGVRVQQWRSARHLVPA